MNGSGTDSKSGTAETQAGSRPVRCDISNEMLFRIGGVLHESRMEECYGKTEFSTRKKWPATLKEFRGQQMDGQPWIDVAIAQVRALVKAGIIPTSDQSRDRGKDG